MTKPALQELYKGSFQTRNKNGVEMHAYGSYSGYSSYSGDSGGAGSDNPYSSYSKSGSSNPYDSYTKSAADSGSKAASSAGNATGGALSSFFKSLGTKQGMQLLAGLATAVGGYQQNKSGSSLPSMPTLGGGQFGSSGNSLSAMGYTPRTGSIQAPVAGSFGYNPRQTAAPNSSYYTYGQNPETQFFQQVNPGGAPITPVPHKRGGSVTTPQRFMYGGMPAPPGAGMPGMGRPMPPPGILAPTSQPGLGRPINQPQGALAGIGPSPAPTTPLGAPPGQPGLSRPQTPQTAGFGPPITQRPLLRAQGGALSRHVQGPGDGTSDSIPARLANGEYVVDAQTVSMLGNGDNGSGAKRLDEMRQNVRKHKGAALAQGRMAPDAKPVENYMGGK